MASKFGLDFGKEHLKVILTLYDPDDLTFIRTSSRVTRKRGIGSGNHYKDTGRRRIQIIASAPKIPETYHICKTFIEKTQIDLLLFNFTGDLKLLNIVSGIMSCASKYPCLYCEFPNSEGNKAWQTDATLRTFGNIKNHKEDWLTSGGKKIKAKEYTNCVATPLFFHENDPDDSLDP
ncbi:uncharacterized protein LOC124817786 [Hydra vulgaris]|uniref:uncharacterized protein LOC124817786 n=1 Tax=Hydra vulgaris TaxID=6087 RepID=UPI001F5E7294|nr:uncharacterized protein LOC124817786 [Hydra vulgaris]